MAISTTISAGFARPGGESYSGASVHVGDTQVHVNTVIPTGHAAEPVACEFAVASVTALFILADKDCTLMTNSSTTPVDEVDLKAGQALIWVSSNGYYACPFSADVTTFYIDTTGVVGNTTLIADILLS